MKLTDFNVLEEWFGAYRLEWWIGANELHIITPFKSTDEATFFIKDFLI